MFQRRCAKPIRGQPLHVLHRVKVLDSRGLRAHCDLTEPCLLMMRQAMDELGLSARAFDKVRRVARTLADLDGSAAIDEGHIGEAVQYRLLDRKF